MKWILLALFLGAGLGYAQEIQTEPPEYPDGVSCSPAGDVQNGRIIAADHPCHCKNMGDPQTSCEKPTTNDPVCRQWCHEQHCSCPLTCESH